MQYVLLVGAIVILIIILLIVIFLIVREVLQRNTSSRSISRHVGFRVIRNQAEFDEFQRGMYVPRPPIRSAADSGIDEVDTSPSSGEVYHWSASSGGHWSESSVGSSVTPPSRGVAHDVSRRFKAVSFSDSVDFSQVDYDDPSCHFLPTVSGILRRGNSEPKLTSFTRDGLRYTAQEPKTKPSIIKSTTPPKAEGDCVMRECHVIEEQEEEGDVSSEPITAL